MSRKGSPFGHEMVCGLPTISPGTCNSFDFVVHLYSWFSGNRIRQESPCGEADSITRAPVNSPFVTELAAEVVSLINPSFQNSEGSRSMSRRNRLVNHSARFFFNASRAAWDIK